MSDIIEKIWERFTVSGNQTACGLDFKDGAIAERIEIAEFDNCSLEEKHFLHSFQY